MKTLVRCQFAFALLFSVAVSLHSQWVRTNGPYGCPAFSLAVSGTNLFAGTPVGMSRSTNSGTTWIDTCLRSRTVFALAVSGANLFAGTTGGGLFRSTDNGSTWAPANTGLTLTDVRAFAVIPDVGGGTHYFAGTRNFSGPGGDGVFHSTNGTTWLPVNNGLTYTSVYALAVSGTGLFAGTSGGGVFLSTNYGTSWTAVNNGLTNTVVYALAVSGINLFAGTYGGGVFLSTNNGTTWTQINTGLTEKNINAFTLSGGNLFAGTDGGVFLSTNNGTSWTAVSSGLGKSYVFALALAGPNLFAGSDSVVWRRPLTEMVTSAPASSIGLPSAFMLCQNYPNPFNPSTTIEFNLSTSSAINLKIFNPWGQEVTSLLSGYLHAGRHIAQWNASGFPSGIYFCRLQSDGLVETKKLILLK